MKKIFLLAAALFSFAVCVADDGYTIKGRITGGSQALKSGKVYLANIARDISIRDTTDIIDGKFLFKGKVTTPEQYVISIEGVKGRLGIFVENEDYAVKGVDSNLSESKVRGGVAQQIMTEFRTENSELEKKYDTHNIVAEYRLPETTQERREEIDDIYDKYIKEQVMLEDEVISNNLVSHFALHKLYVNVAHLTSMDVKEKLAPFKADIRFEGNRFIASIEETIAILEKFDVGNIAPDFRMKDPSGKWITLSEIYKKNKITMIDFWAAWCGPCRKLNPQLVELYKKFHNQGFEILGVSLDTDRATWLKAIKDDKLTWPQISDLNSWSSKVVKLYNIRAIPMSIFVDKDGKIVGNRLHKNKIEDFLKENL